MTVSTSTLEQPGDVAADFRIRDARLRALVVHVIPERRQLRRDRITGPVLLHDRVVRARVALAVGYVVRKQLAEHADLRLQRDKALGRHAAAAGVGDCCVPVDREEAGVRKLRSAVIEQVARAVARREDGEARLHRRKSRVAIVRRSDGRRWRKNVNRLARVRVIDERVPPLSLSTEISKARCGDDDDERKPLHVTPSRECSAVGQDL